MSETKLLPCPFCDSDNLERGSVYTTLGEDIFIRCRNCNTKLQLCIEHGEYELVKRWNTRKPVERILERLEERQEDCYALYAIAFDPEDRDGFDAYSDAIEIVKQEVQHD